MLHQLGSRGTTEICNESLRRADRDRGHQRFKEFVEDTVRGMINLENERRGDLSSSLPVFCRIDVAVCQPSPGGPFHYYVNELERSLTVGLFRRTSSAQCWTMIHTAISEIPAFIGRSRAVSGPSQKGWIG